jgi:hypothetical protein
MTDWKSIIEEFIESQKSLQDFCKDKGLHYKEATKFIKLKDVIESHDRMTTTQAAKLMKMNRPTFQKHLKMANIQPITYGNTQTIHKDDIERIKEIKKHGIVIKEIHDSIAFGGQYPWDEWKKEFINSDHTIKSFALSKKVDPKIFSSRTTEWTTAKQLIQHKVQTRVIVAAENEYMGKFREKMKTTVDNAMDAMEDMSLAMKNMAQEVSTFSIRDGGDAKLRNITQSYKTLSEASRLLHLMLRELQPLSLQHCDSPQEMLDDILVRYASEGQIDKVTEVVKLKAALNLFNSLKGKDGFDFDQLKALSQAQLLPK